MGLRQIVSKIVDWWAAERVAAANRRAHRAWRYRCERDTERKP